MSESWLSGMAWGSWTLAVAIYVFGIASGWLIWGGRRSVPEEDAGRGVAAGGETQSQAAASPPAGLDALESEIRKARELLEANDDDTAAFSEELANLDHSIKRGNGRLKLVLRALQRASAE